MSNTHPTEPSPPDVQQIKGPDSNSNSIFRFTQPRQKPAFQPNPNRLEQEREPEDAQIKNQKDYLKSSEEIESNLDSQSKSEPQSDPITLAEPTHASSPGDRLEPSNNAVETETAIQDDSSNSRVTNLPFQEGKKRKTSADDGDDDGGETEKIQDLGRRDSRIQIDSINSLSKSRSKNPQRSRKGLKGGKESFSHHKGEEDEDVDVDSGPISNSNRNSIQTIYLTEDDREIKFHFFFQSSFKVFLWYLLCFLSVGIVYLVGRWVPRFFVKFTCTPLDESIFAKGNERKRVRVGVKTRYESIELIPLKTSTFSSPLPSSTVFPLSMRVPFSSASEALTGKQLTISDLLSQHESPHKSFSEKERDFSLPQEEEEEEEGEEMISSIKTLNYRSMSLILHPMSGKLLLLSDWRDPSWTSSAAVQDGLSSDQVELRRTLFGLNLIDVVGASTLDILIVEATHPFYIFSLLSIALWSYDDYVPYAIVIAAISIAGIAATTITTKQSANRMRKMSRFICQVRVKRDGKWQTVQSDSLVPGDIIDSLSDGIETQGTNSSLETLPCDCVLLEGDAIVNESMLTGESVPVVKSATSAETMRNVLCNSRPLKEIEKHLLSGGTKLIRVRPGETDLSAESHPQQSQSEPPAARSLVIKTGFNTAKGSLIRSMLFPKPVDQKFYVDAFKFIMILCIIAVIGFMGALVYFLKIGVDSVEIALRALDLFTICVPPALPAAMSVCITFSIARLKKKLIYCTSPQRINVAGKVGVVVFDKTGTLTAEGLDVLGVRNSKGKGQNFSQLLDSVEVLTQDETSEELSESASSSSLSLTNALGCTHDLNLLNDELIGEPLEISMIEWSKYEIEKQSFKVILSQDGQTQGEARNLDGGNSSVSVVKSILNGDRFAIVKKFDFVASLRRMSVIVKAENKEDSIVYVKGAPESLSEIIDRSSLPDDFQVVLDSITHAGYRVLALAGKRVQDLSWNEIQRMKRSSAESQLTFLGLLIFENPLKPTSASTILTLQKDAKIPTKMCTGDAVLTAISCAKECNILPPQALIYVARIRDSNPIRETEKMSNENQISEIEWINVNDSNKTLDPYTLDPIGSESQHQNLKLKDIGLAITGETFKFLLTHSSKETLERILVHAQVFARMSPEQKGELVENLHNLGWTTAFCGDGANDMSALKAADVGLSLSEAEASVAAPFTSKEESIDCLEYLIREGRSTLITSSAMFSFMAVYSICEYFSVLLLYGKATSFDNGEYLYIDIFIVLPIAFGLANSWPSLKLSSSPPPSRLMCRRVVLSLLGQFVLLILSQATVYILLHKQSFYIPPVLDPENLQLNDQDNTAVFLSSLYAYLIAATVWSLGPPHRRPLYYNIILFPAILVLSALAIYFTFMKSGPLFDVFGFVSLTTEFQGIIFGVALVQILLACFYEFYLLDHLSRFFSKPVQAYRRRKQSGKVDQFGNPLEAQVEKRWRTVAREIYR